jgi:hypothetical protein
MIGDKANPATPDLPRESGSPEALLSYPRSRFFAPRFTWDFSATSRKCNMHYVKLGRAPPCPSYPR